VTFNLYRTCLPPLCVHTSDRICTNLRIESRAGWGAATPYGDTNDLVIVIITNTTDYT